MAILDNSNMSPNMCILLSCLISCIYSIAMEKVDTAYNEIDPPQQTILCGISFWLYITCINLSITCRQCSRMYHYITYLYIISQKCHMCKFQFVCKGFLHQFQRYSSMSLSNINHMIFFIHRISG
jgi:hypothetical protein